MELRSVEFFGNQQRVPFRIVGIAVSGVLELSHEPEADHHVAVLAGEQVGNGMVVRHEMLHELLGRGDHPAAYFQVRCAGLVACNEV